MTGCRATPEHEEGWVLFDALIGAVILTLGLVSSSLVFGQGDQSLAQVTDRQGAVALASSLLSVATAFGCGAETGLSLPGTAPPGPAGSYPYTGTIWEQCAPVYAGAPGAPFAGALGDPPDTLALPGGSPYAWATTVDGTAYDVSYRAQWTQAPSDADGCPRVLAGGAAAIAPLGQTRTVTVQWVEAGQVHQFTASVFGGVPVDSALYASPAAGAIEVTGMAPGSLAQLSVPVASFEPGGTGTVTLDRGASAGGGTGCAWFPFLPPATGGTYRVTYYAHGDPSVPPTAVSPPGLGVDTGAVTRWTP